MMNAALRAGVAGAPASQRAVAVPRASAVVRRRADDGRARLQTSLECAAGDRLFVDLSWGPDDSESFCVDVYAVHAGFVDVRGYTPISTEMPRVITVRRTKR